MPKRRRQPPPQKLKRQKLETPKLRLNACQEFLQYSMSGYFGMRRTISFALRYSFVNEKFREGVKQIDKSVMKLPVLLTEMNFGGSNDSTDFFSIKRNKTKDKLDAILNLLKMVEYPTVEFQFEKQRHSRKEFNKDLIENFAYFCRKLKDIETLKKIYVDFALVTYIKISRPTVFIFSSLLPKNKSIYMKTRYDMSSILQKHENPAESLTINGLSFNKCTAQIFKSNTKELFFNAKHRSTTTIPKLHYLRVLGPFSANPTLELLGIDVDLMFSKFDPKNIKLQKIEKYLWNSKFLPNHRKAFEYLRQINNKLELQLKTNETEDVYDNQSCISFYKEQLQRAKSIIDMAQEFGFKIKVFHINTVFSYQLRVSESRMAEKLILVVTKKFTKSTKMKVAKKDDENDENINLIQYSEVPIKLKILFHQKLFQGACMRARASRVFDSDDEIYDESDENESDDDE